MKTCKLGDICQIRTGSAGKEKFCEKPGIVIPRENHTLTARVVNPPFSVMPRALYLVDFADGTDLNAVAAQLNAKLPDLAKGSVKPCVVIEEIALIEVEV